MTRFNGYWKDVGTTGLILGGQYGACGPHSGVQSVRGVLEDYTKNDAIEPLYIAKRRSCGAKHHG